MQDHHDEQMPRGTFRWIAALVAAGWIAAVAFVAWRGWPHMSLDLGVDAATRAAYQAAVWRHAATSAAIALVPAIALMLAARFFDRR